MCGFRSGVRPPKAGYLHASRAIHFLKLYRIDKRSIPTSRSKPEQVPLTHISHCMCPLPPLCVSDLVCSSSSNTGGECWVAAGLVIVVRALAAKVGGLGCLGIFSISYSDLPPVAYHQFLPPVVSYKYNHVYDFL